MTAAMGWAALALLCFQVQLLLVIALTVKPGSTVNQVVGGVLMLAAMVGAGVCFIRAINAA